MSGLWHSVREVPERNRWVLVSFPDGAFAMEHLASEKAWVYILEKCDQGVKCRYCHDLSVVQTETKTLDTYHLNSAEDGSCLTLKARDYKDPQIVCLNDQGGSVMAVEENGNAGTLRANTHGNEQIVCYENHANDSRVKEMGDSCQTLNSRMGTGGGNLPLVQEYFNWHSQNHSAVEITDNCSPTIPAAMGMGGANMTTPIFIQESLFDAVGVDQYNMDETGDVTSSLGTNCGMSTGRQSVAVVHGAETPITSEDCGHPCTCNHNGLENCVAMGFEPGIAKRDGSDSRFTEEFVGTLRSNAGDNQHAVCTSTVRRLLPIECERLMGFPDNHTRIEWNGKPEEECPDAPRYKACGNSMAVNVMRWIGMQIDRVDKMEIAEK